MPPKRNTTKFIYVEGGDGLRDGQVAISEVHPDHPFVYSEKQTVLGEHQVYVVKGDPKCGGAWAARTRDVSKAIALGALVEADPPEGTPAPIEGPATDTSQQAAAVAARNADSAAALDDDDEDYSPVASSSTSTLKPNTSTTPKSPDKPKTP